MSKLSNAIGANSVTCRVLECDVLQNKCSDWLNVMLTGLHCYVRRGTLKFSRFDFSKYDYTT